MGIYELFNVFVNGCETFYEIKEHYLGLFNIFNILVYNYCLTQSNKAAKNLYSLLETFTAMDQSVIISLYKKNYNFNKTISSIINDKLFSIKDNNEKIMNNMILGQASIFFLGLVVLKKYNVSNCLIYINIKPTTDLIANNYTIFKDADPLVIDKLKADYRKVIMLISKYNKYLDDFFTNKFDLLMIRSSNKKITLMSLYLLLIFTDDKIREIENSILPVFELPETAFNDLLI